MGDRHLPLGAFSFDVAIIIPRSCRSGGFFIIIILFYLHYCFSYTIFVMQQQGNLMIINDYIVDYEKGAIDLCLDVYQTDGANGEIDPVWKSYPITPQTVAPGECVDIDWDTQAYVVLDDYGNTYEYDIDLYLSEIGDTQILWGLGLVKRYYVAGGDGWKTVYSATLPDGEIESVTINTPAVQEVARWNQEAKEVSLAPQERLEVA